MAPVTDNINLVCNKAALVIHWENLRVAVPIEVEVTNHVLAACHDSVAKAKANDWRTAFNAARFCFQNEVALDEGRGWLDKSLGVQKAYANLTLLARWQMKDGKKDDAIATAKQAIAAGKASKDKVDTSEAKPVPEPKEAKARARSKAPAEEPAPAETADDEAAAPRRASKRSEKGITAEEMGAKQREISVSEFFTKNRHLLGFDSPRKALL